MFRPFVISQLDTDFSDNYTCSLSPEVNVFLNCPDYVLIDFVDPSTHPLSEIPSELFKAKVCHDVEKNCVAFKDSKRRPQCYISPLKAKECLTLESVELSAFASTESTLEDIKNVLETEKVLPIIQGKEILSRGVCFKVESSSPSCQGLLNISTTDVHLKLLEESSCDFPNFEETKKLLNFVVALTKRNKLFFESIFKLWRLHQFQKIFKEMPARFIDSNYNAASTVVVNDLCFPSDFGQLQTVSGIHINVRVIKHDLSDRNCIMVSPTFLYNAKAKDQYSGSAIDGQQWRLKPILESEAFTIATKIEISIVFSPVHLHLDPTDVDLLLKSYFDAPKYLHFFGKRQCVFSFDIDDYLSAETEHLSWTLPTLLDKTVYFQVDDIFAKDTENSGDLYCVSAQLSELCLKTREVHIFMPPKTQYWTPSFATSPKLLAFPRLPPYLDQKCQDLANVVRCFPAFNKNVKNSDDYRHIPYSPILLEVPKGGGGGLFVKELSRRLGFHLFTQDCVNLVSETSGATEAKIRALMASLHGCHLLHLTNVQRLTRNPDNNGTDHRVLDALRKELYAKSVSKLGIVTIAEINHDQRTKDVVGLFDLEFCLDDLISIQRTETLQWMLKSNHETVNGGIICGFPNFFETKNKLTFVLQLTSKT